MQIEHGKSQHEPSKWPHRWAVVLVCATFPLLWVGGLVTTTDSGMAVPDWPTTFGYNPFLYPITTWLAGPWDEFVEHGHRLLGSLVGLLTIALVISQWRAGNRTWVFRLSLAALALVIAQGVLGGMRVRLDERSLAMFHGITGPVFFALTVVLAIVTSTGWQTKPSRPALDHTPVAHIRLLAVVTCVIVYLQMVFGAVLRHVPVAAEPATFMLAAKFHLLLAGILTLHIIALIWMIARHTRGAAPLGRLAVGLGLLVAAQQSLGVATWLVKYYVPSWAPSWLAVDRSAIVDGGWLQTHIVTAHVAVGSLMLATTVALALYASRMVWDLYSITSQASLRRREAAV